MQKDRLAALSAFGLFVASCATPAPSGGAPSVRAEPSTAASSVPPMTASTVAPSASESAPSADAPLAVPEAVAKLHRNAFRDGAVDPKLGRVLFFVTLHGAAFERGEVFPLVLFDDGSIATWRQTSTGPEEPFFAKLGPEEKTRASELVDAIATAPDPARDASTPSTAVMGISVRAGEQVRTRYFDHARIPAPLGSLVGLLKQRLEATNRSP